MNEKPHVVFALSIGLTLGGANTWVLKVAERLAQLGWRVSVVEHTCVKWHPRMDNYTYPEGVAVIQCGGTTPMDADLADLSGYVDVYKKLLPAIVIPNFCDTIYAVCAQLVVQNPTAIKVIGVMHGHADDYKRSLTYYADIIQTYLTKNLEMEEDVKKMFSQRVNDVYMHPYAVEAVYPHPAHKLAHSEPVKVVYAGRITDSEKRVSNLVPLAKNLSRRGVHYALHIIGEGGYKNWLVQEVNDAEADVRERIHVHNMMMPEQLASFLSTADVGLLVSNTESGGLAALEAMAQGCVPVCTACPGPKTFIRSGENGFLVPIDDMEAMADSIAELDQNRPRLQQLREAAWQTICDQYSYEAYMPWFEQLLVDTQKRPGGIWSSERPLQFPLKPPLKKKSPGERLKDMIRSLMNR